MRAVVHRVKRAEVSVEGRVKGSIGQGFLVLLGIEDCDSPEDGEWLAGKIARLRIFNDSEGVMNLPIGEVDGEMMGDEADISDGTARIKLSADSESPTAVIVSIDIIKNGSVWQTLNPFSPSYQDVLMDDAVTEDGYYRVEVTSYDVVSEEVFFAWSNPVFVEVDNSSLAKQES